MISIQQHDFDIAEEYDSLLHKNSTGAIVTFVGRVRDFAQADKQFYLQHYPGMTEKVLTEIEQQAHQRWSLLATRIIHRVGHLQVDDQIVYVGVSSEHRKNAFQACEYMIDILKTQAPFWKKEGQTWVEAKTSDEAAANIWLQD
ncbi:molybdenum cofactor biosynthesis protein MoaE [Agarilytica rhodophyticola]|uniref:molybdenum cofactor biosynthesis protein MoaE n=1 Tax=Agarilytica rhodophyticola TaxID=1737490 RepID=UPI000B34238B|nr:molybdenum cofactor biosynthesis protein MoaE [Agarilytica rhodophyticola]